MKRILQKKGWQQGYIFLKNGLKKRKNAISLIVAFLLLISGLFNTGGTVAFAAGVPDALPATAVTASAFTANWSTVDGTTNYYLDVATDSGFINKVADNQDMGTATTCPLSSLSTVTNYFYRVKAGSAGSYSNVIYVQTPAKDGEFSASSPATSGNEYSISTADQLKALADNVKAGTRYDGVSIKLADNIDLAGYSSGSGWEPIGVRISGTNYPFQGKFDGNGYVVKNMYINRSTSEAIGLFGVIDGATVEIKNVGVVDCNVTGGSRVGAIVGWALGSGNVTISECFTTGRVSSTRYVGGIAGEAETPSFTIKNCYSAANITGSRNDYDYDEGDAGFGGIVGYVYLPGARTTNIINCYSTGEIQGPNCVGGIVGGIETRRGSAQTLTVRNCAALNKSITSTFATGTEDVDGLNNGSTSTLRAANLQNRVIGGIWENTVNGTSFTYTSILNNLYALDTMSVKYQTSIAVSAKTQTTTSVDGYSITATDLENNAHNWTNGTVSDPGGTIPAGSVTYFDYGDAGSASSVWYYYQDRQVLPVLHRYIDNYQPVLIQPGILSDTVPYATDVYANSTSQTLMTGNTLTAAYAYHENSAGAESGSTYQWYRYDTQKGGTGTAISGAGGTTYTLTSSDVGKYISFATTPASATKTGSAVESGRVGGVAAAPTTANTGNNGVTASPATVSAGSSTSLIAAGDRQNASGTVSGDERYIPVSWTSTETGMSGSFTLSGSAYTSAYTPAAEGTYTVTATFQKQTYDGSSWSDSAGSTDTKTVDVTVTAATTLANAASNSVTASPATVTAGSSTTLVATGDRQNAAGTVSGDERFIPVSWTSTETGMSGSFTANGGVYTSAYTPTTAGSYTVTATFQKQTYDGASWTDTAGSTDTKTAAVTVQTAEYTVAFSTSGGSSVSSQTIVYNNKITRPADPARSGFTFGGWYKDAACTSAWNFDSDVVTGNITLYAKWTEASTGSQTSISGLSSTYKMYEGGRIILNPQPSGGTWDWDGQFFTAATWNPITFTALKAGTSTITYTINGVSYSFTVTILDTVLPMTGQDNTLLWVFGLAAGICGGAGLFISIVLRKKKIQL